MADRGIATDPSVGVRLPAVPRRDSTWTLPTTEQVRALLEHAPEGFAPCIGLAAFAGLRSGEIAGVQVGDVDFLRGVLHVRRQVQQGEKASAVEVRPPKHGSFRDVAIPPGLVSMLAEHVAQHRAGDDPTRFLLAMGGEGPMSPSSMAWHWRVTARGAGIAQFKPRGWAVSLHDLRHFYASGLIAAGCDVVHGPACPRARQGHHDAQHLQPHVAHGRGPDEGCGWRLLTAVLERLADSLRLRSDLRDENRL